MLLALDVGNSAVKGALYDGADPVEVFSIPIEKSSLTTSALVDKLEAGLLSHFDDVSIDQVGMASVVPEAAAAVETVLQGRTDVGITRIHPTMSLPFDLAYETPNTLGADRLAAAAAGWSQFGMTGPPRSVLVVDAGTAVTVEVIHRTGVYQGGTIAAGPALHRRALQNGTAQLPSVPLELPDAPVGRSTQAALQSGIMWGLVDTVDGMTDRLAGALPDTPQIVTTGGWGKLLLHNLDRVDHHEPHLVLDGIRLLTRGANP